MDKLPASLRLGKKLEGDANDVLNILDDTYQDLVPAINRKPSVVILDRDPTTDDDENDLGDFWLNSSTGAKFVLTTTTPTWTAY